MNNMIDFNFWTISGGIAIVLLVIYWHGENSIWGGLTFGAIIGLVVGIFGEGIVEHIIKGGIIGVFVGFSAELLSKIGNYFKQK